MDFTNVLSVWKADLQTLARSGSLAQTIEAIFSGATRLTTHQKDLLREDLEALARGDYGRLPRIEVLDHQTLLRHPGAYSAHTKTIYINEEVLGYSSLAMEVLTHELAHFITDKYFDGSQKQLEAHDFTRALLGQDHALALTNAKTNAQQHAGQITLPEHEEPLPVVWFDTDLHIRWLQVQLPMLNAKAFDVISTAQNDSDAFYSPFKGPMLSPYGLQTHNATHFDNNNIRGGLEAMRKRWIDGIQHLNADQVQNTTYSMWSDASRVGPSFSGQDAGIENLLYRFGQISHAFQDFYSHSNWLELSKIQGRDWIGSQALLETSLDIPLQLNPGDRVPNAPQVMVAMSGPDYDASFKRVGVGVFGGLPKVVNWWVALDQSNWGEVYASPKSGGGDAGNYVAGLMTGAVNGAVYYETDYSVPLRALDRTGTFEQEYFRGFSHGGLAGAALGQWVSPLSKDKADNGRFSDKSLNKSLFEEAQVLADLQLRHDWDRLGNLIFKNHGEQGLQKFAQYAVVESYRDLYVATYSKPEGRWSWDADNSGLKAARLFLATKADHEHDHDGDHAFFEEPPIRYIEVFFEDAQAKFNTPANRTYLTQFYEDGQWVDSALGLVGSHHDHMEDNGPEVFQPAQIQYADRGGRALWFESNSQNGHYLGTIYYVENVNPEARVFINKFDVGRDELWIVDGDGNRVEFFDIDHGDFHQIRKAILEKYNVKINARPESQLLTQSKVLLSGDVAGPVLLSADEFFGDHDTVHLVSHSPTDGFHTDFVFVGHDETLPWLSLRQDGLLEISDLSTVAAGTYKIYVSVSDGAGMLEGALIVLSIDPKVMVGSRVFAPTTSIEVNFTQSSESAVSLFGQIYDENGNPTSGLQHLATRVGDASGVPMGVDPSFVTSGLAPATGHGKMQFFAYFYGSDEMVMLDLHESEQGQFSLQHQGDLFAQFTTGTASTVSPYIDELYFVGLEDLMFGIPLHSSVVFSESKAPDSPFLVSFETTVSREAYFDGDFGLFLADLQTGHVVDPTSGMQLENAILDVRNMSSYAVYEVAAPKDGQVQSSVTFQINGKLNLNNLAFLPYYIAHSPNGSELFLGGSAGNRDGVSHIARIGNNTFGVEDMVGGDYDFDDVVVTINSFTVTDFV